MNEALPSSRLSDVEKFIARWQGKDGSEKANYQLFLTELCHLLTVEIPQPATADNQINSYVFERRVDMADSKGKSTPGFIDLYKRDCFVLEAKSTKKKQGSGGLDMALERAYNQADGYIKNLPQYEKKPPFLIVTDVGHVLQLYSEFTCSGSTYTAFPDSHSHRIRLDDLRQPHILERLRLIWLDPHSLDLAKKAALVTSEIAKHLAELAKSLEQQYDAEVVASFLMRCLFSMFAEDVGLLPADSFKSLLERLKDKPASCAPALQNLWNLMDKGGYDSGTMETIKRFNGGLFAHATALALSKPQIELLLQAAQADWRFVEPAIFGTLLERALNPKERHKLGAHYTPRAYVERLVFPTVIDPLRQAWKDVQAAAVLLAKQAGKGKKQAKLKEAVEVVRQFHQQLCHLRILDPACGSGNFLYVTLEHLKKLEGEIFNFLDDLGFTQGQLEMEGVSVNPQQFLGLEVNPRAARIAEMVLWIGYLQWHFRTHGNVAPAEPILRDFHNIECRDAVLAWEAIEPVLDDMGQQVTRWDGVTMKVHPVTGKGVPDESARVGVVRYMGARKAMWPKADFIVGNPPFIGAAPMRAALGDGYVEALRKVWKEVPDSSDFVMYWWHQAAETVRLGEAKRFGFITTNSIRQTFNRRVIQAQLEAEKPLSLLFAIPDHPWVDSADGAAVRIAMTVGVAGEREGVLQTILHEEAVITDDARLVEFKTKVGQLHADLAIGANVASSKYLYANSSLSHRGCELAGAGFIVTPEEARSLGLGTISGTEKHIKPYLNGRDVSQISRQALVIDMYNMEIYDIQTQYPYIYQWLYDRVRPEREQNQRKSRKHYWWLFGETRKEFRKAIQGLNQYISTIETSKHRFFVMLEAMTLPDNMLVNITLDDAFYLGILSSRLHTHWALSKGGSLEDRPRYNKTVCFETFPFPDATETQKANIRALAEQLDTHRKRQQTQHPNLTLTNMYNVLEKLRTDEVLNAKEKITHQQGLITLLKELHDNLDRAVFDAYGWNDLAPRLVGKAGATTPLVDKTDDQTQAEEELLTRLVALNAHRAEEEAQGHIRWLRPDFQAPHAQQVQTDLIIEGEGSIQPEASPASTKLLTWPERLNEKIQLVRQLLARNSQTLVALGKQFKNKPNDLDDVLMALCDLGHVTQTDETYQLI